MSTTTASPAGANATDLSTPDLLKQATWPLHQQAEKHPFLSMTMSGRLPRDAYIAQLEQMLLVHTALEGHLTRLRPTTPPIAAVLQDWHLRRPLILTDLAALGGNSSPAPLPPTAALIAELDALAAAQPEALLGSLYVLEGSTNGAKYIAMALARGLAITDMRGLSYQVPHGDALPQRWAKFRTDLAAVPFTPAQRQSLVASAERMFGYHVQLFDALSARLSPPAPVSP